MRLPRSLGAFRVASLLLCAAALAWAVDLYVSRIRDRIAVGEPAHDLGVFLRAGAAVLDGRSPYEFRGDETYAYPPLLAFLASPIHGLGVGAAMTVSILVSFAAIAAAFWLLGVRDWRCYCIVPLYAVTRSAVALGTVAPLLVLATAIAWRWRHRLVAPALAVGAAVTLKLFLWPLLLWLALTRRSRTMLAALGSTTALVLVPWAALGFAGLTDYPSLLNRLSDQEAAASYSVFAMGVRAHLPDAAATMFAGVVTLSLLAAMIWVARDSRRTAGNRDVALLTLAIAVALAASPIVWVHYFLLLFVPLALVRPRLSALWLVPVAYYPLGETAWPGGDARKLGLALATTLVLLAPPLRRGRTPMREHLWHWANLAWSRLTASLDRPGRRWLLAPAASLRVSLVRRTPCFVHWRDGAWVHHYRGAAIPHVAIGGASPPAAFVAEARDIFLYGYTPRPGDTVFDIGAGVGADTLLFSRLVGGSGRVVSLEAHPDTYGWLARLCELNRLENVIPLQVAASDAEGEAAISDCDEFLINTVVGSENGSIRVRARRLDEIAQELGITSIDLLKMNIEGAERLAIRGLDGVIASTRHVCISCHDFLAERGASEQLRTKALVRAFLLEHGFRVTSRDQAPEPWTRDYLYGANTRIA